MSTKHRSLVTRSTVRRRSFLVVVAFGVAAAAAPSGAAAVTTTVKLSSSTLSVRVTGETLGPSASANTIFVSEDATATYVDDVTVDIDFRLVAEAPCFRVSAARVGCPANPLNNTLLDVTPGRGDDTVVVSLPVRSASGIARVVVSGGGGNDIIAGGAGPETLEGDGRSGNGQLPVAGSEFDIDGNDILTGNGGPDTLRGNGGDDYLNGGGTATALEQPNTLDGGPGADVFDLGRTLGADIVIGGSGADAPVGSVSRKLQTPIGRIDTTLGDIAAYGSRTFSSTVGGIVASLNGVADDGGAGENDHIGKDVESLIGSVRDDILIGSPGNNRLEGGLGVDRVEGVGGNDVFALRDGIRDRCYVAGSGDTVDLDLLDPRPADCAIPVLPTTLTVTLKPADETIPYVAIGTRIRAAGPGRLAATVRCPREAVRACTGTLSIAAAPRSGRALARVRYRVAPNRAGRVLLAPGVAAVRRLRAAGRARLTAVAQGTSSRGPTTTEVVRWL